MNRREFLKTMLALGVSIAVPFPLNADAATEQEIDAAWSSFKDSPITFEVQDYGTVWLQGVGIPSTRRECLGIDDSPGPDLDSIAEFMDEDWRIESLVATAFLEVSGSEEEDPESVSQEEVMDWLDLHPEDISYVSDRITEWLDSEDLDDFDYENAELRGYTPQGAALSYWRDYPDIDPSDLGIVIVEGECPGSSYFAAELRMPIDEANRVAQEKGVPIRFVAV